MGLSTRDNKMGQNSKLHRGQNCIGRGQSVRVRLPMPINVSAFMIVNTKLGVTEIFGMVGIPHQLKLK